MSSNKINFINDLLSSKKIKIEEKSKILELTKSELINLDNENEFIIKRVENIEKILKVTDLNISAGRDLRSLNTPSEIETSVNANNMSDNEQQSDNKNYYIKSTNQVKFLEILNNNNYTKHLTHDLDSDDYTDLALQFGGNYNYEKHLEKIKEVFSVLTKKDSPFIHDYPSLERITISSNLYSKVNTYINGNGVWGEEENEMNWSNDELLNWCNNNKGKAPAPGNDLGYEGFRYRDKTFKDVILDFKNEIHIRNSNSIDFILKKVMFETKNDFRSKLDIDKNINESIDFFTDVERLKQMIRLIFKLIIEKHQNEEKPKITFNLKINEKKVELLILHNNSVFGQDVETLRFGKTLKNLMKISNGLCDIEIKGKFSNGKYYSLPIWRVGRKIENDVVFENNKQVLPSQTISELRESIDGVLYKLTFDIGL